MKTIDLLIIGAGPAGLTAGLYAARGGRDTVIAEKVRAGEVEDIVAERRRPVQICCLGVVERIVILVEEVICRCGGQKFNHMTVVFLFGSSCYSSCGILPVVVKRLAFQWPAYKVKAPVAFLYRRVSLVKLQGRLAVESEKVGVGD